LGALALRRTPFATVAAPQRRQTISNGPIKLLDKPTPLSTKHTQKYKNEAFVKKVNTKKETGRRKEDGKHDKNIVGAHIQDKTY
jgi:hypothetical protein